MYINILMKYYLKYICENVFVGVYIYVVNIPYTCA